MKLFKLSTFAIITAIATTANAGVVDNAKEGVKDVFNPAAVGIEVGSLGYGANIAWGVNEYAEVQAGWVGGDLTDLANKSDFDIDDVDFSAETDFSNPYVGVQLRPMKNWLTVGTGVMYMGNSSINAVATPEKDVSFTYNGESFKAATDNAKIDAEVTFKNTMAPYLTLGFRPNINNRFGLFGEIGAAYTGGTSTSVEANADGFTYKNPVTGNWEAGTLTADQLQKLEDDARKEIEDEIDGNDNWYPIVKVGATVRF